MSAERIPAGRLLATYVRDPYREKFPFLEGAQFTGTGTAAARLSVGPLAFAASGTLRTEGVDAELNGLRVRGLAASLPFLHELAGGRRVLAVGRLAERVTDAPYLRHPAHGGAAGFRAGLLRFCAGARL